MCKNSRKWGYRFGYFQENVSRNLGCFIPCRNWIHLDILLWNAREASCPRILCSWDSRGLKRFWCCLGCSGGYWCWYCCCYSHYSWHWVDRKFLQRFATAFHLDFDLTCELKKLHFSFRKSKHVILKQICPFVQYILHYCWCYSSCCC